MPEIISPTVPAQPVSNPPLRKGFPIVVGLIGIIALIGIANLGNLMSSKGAGTTRSSLSAKPSTITPAQVKNYQATQAIETSRDTEQRQQQALQNSANQPPYAVPDVPGPEADTAAPMTAAQKQTIYGDSPNAPKRTSNGSQAHAEAKQRQLAREKEHQDALASDTVAIDFAQGNTAAKPTAVLGDHAQETEQASGEDIVGPSASSHPALQPASEQRTAKNDPMAPYPFDQYQGQLYRVFEGTVFEGVVTNHIDGALAGPIIVMLTTDYYSHDHQQLLLPQGTRLLGDVKSVGSSQQRKLMVIFERAVCPDGFSVSLNNFTGLDPIGTTGLATHVNNHYLSSFAAAAVIGGIGGLAQIGNSSSVLDPSAQIRNGISEQTAQESEQILNKFLNRLPTIAVKEGSRARVYINRDISIPSYAEHRVDPAL